MLISVINPQYIQYVQLKSVYSPSTIHNTTRISHKDPFLLHVEINGRFDPEENMNGNMIIKLSCTSLTAYFSNIWSTGAKKTSQKNCSTIIGLMAR